MSYKRIEKGTVIGTDWYFVVVEAVVQGDQLYLHCICDNANNVYSFEIRDLLDDDECLILSPLKAIEIEGWGAEYTLSDGDREIYTRIGRSIPVDVIAEVLAGKHDDRFS